MEKLERVTKVVLHPLLVDVTAAIGALIFVTGGIFFRFEERKTHMLVDLRLFGPWLVLAALAYCVKRDSHATRAFTNFGAWLANLTAWRAQAFVAVAIVLLAAAHTLATVQRHLAFETGMDLTIYANACRNWLFSTTKGDVYLFADHFEPVLGAFAPLCQIGDPAIELLCIQGAALALGGLGIARLARRASLSRLASVCLAFLYVQNVAVLQTIYYDFHLLALCIAVYPWLWYAVVARRWWLVALVAIVALGLKESVGPTIVGFGAYLLVAKDTPRRLAGVAAIAVGAVAFVVILTAVYPHFRSGEGTAYFAKYYGHLGTSFGAFVHTVLTRPFYVLSTVLLPRKLSYMVRLIGMTGLVALVRPRLLLPALPAILINVLSNDINLYTFHYHYEAEIIPMLVCGVIADPPSVRFGVVTPLRAFIVAQLFILGFSPVANLRTFQPSGDDYALQKALDERVLHATYPGEAIAATQRVAAHLTKIPRLYLIDYIGHENDYLRGDRVVAAYPSEDLGFFAWEYFESVYVPLLDATLSRTYEDPWLRGFRLWQRRDLGACEGADARD